jgi:hypothetical protein
VVVHVEDDVLKVFANALIRGQNPNLEELCFR